MAIEAKHVHFIGIGGIGMSALATILAENGIKVSGCDLDVSQKSITRLRKLGCTIQSNHGSVGCFSPDIDLFVCSTAVARNMPELQSAQERGVRIISRAELLAALMKEKYSIAIAGSHGKTTTSSLIAHILMHAKMDPTVAVGGFIGNFGHNARSGKSNFLVAEADESDRSFTLLHPSLAVVTNIDLEHLDTYHDLADVQKAFCEFISHISPGGIAVICIDDPGALDIVPLIMENGSITVITYGTHVTADVQLLSYELAPDNSTITVRLNNGTKITCTVPIPGIHNAYNATAAWAVSEAIGIPIAETISAIESFKGVEQRFSYRGTFQGADIFDDYGHHPTEIHHMLAVAKKCAKKRLIIVFQPHRFSRTQKLWNDFVQVFAQGSQDLLIITDIYPASEAPIEGITGEKLAQASGAQYIPFDNAYHHITNALTEQARDGDLILFLGAGKLNRLSEKLTQQI